MTSGIAAPTDRDPLPPDCGVDHGPAATVAAEVLVDEGVCAIRPGTDEDRAPGCSPAPVTRSVGRPPAGPRGTVAVDREREIAFGPATPVTVTFAHDGARVLDVRAALAAAAAERLLVRENNLQEVP